MAHEPWLVFGLDGRSAADINSAVQLGYRRFDTAESYRTPTAESTTTALADAVKDLPREQIEVLYKFDVNERESKEQTKQRVTEAANQFGGKLDAVLIHNLDGVDPRAVKQTWNALHELKRDGVIGKAGVGNIMPKHAELVYELASTNKFDVVDFSPNASPSNSQQGSQQGSQHGSEHGSPRSQGKDSDKSSLMFGAVENSVRGVLADPEIKEILKNLGDKADLYYYNVVRTMGEIKDHHARRNSGASLDAGRAEGIAAIAETATYATNAPTNMILSSGNSDTRKSNLDTFRHDVMDFAHRDFMNADQVSTAQAALDKWSLDQSVCRRNDPTPLPKDVTDRLAPLFENANAERAQAHQWISSHPGMPIERESVQQWLIQQRGFNREQLEGLSVPDRVGLLPNYRDMRLGDVMAAQLGVSNCNHKWADQLSAPLLQSVDTWRDAALNTQLTEIAVPVTPAPSTPDSRRSPSPLGEAQMSASAAASMTLPVGQGRVSPRSSTSSDGEAATAARAAAVKPATTQGARR